MRSWHPTLVFEGVTLGHLQPRPMRITLVERGAKIVFQAGSHFDKKLKNMTHPFVSSDSTITTFAEEIDRSRGKLFFGELFMFR